LTFHLQNLQRAGLILQQRVSRQLIYSADFEVMNGLIGYLTENCCAGSGGSCGEACEPVRPKKTTKRAAKGAPMFSRQRRRKPAARESGSLRNR
jgi:hypothetical protein